MKGILFLLLMFVASGLRAQVIAIDWIEVSGDKVVVHYNLEDSNPNHQYLINLYSSQDNFTNPLTKVSGDVGTEVKPARDKKITWDATKELTAFKGNLTFEIRGRVYIPFVKILDFGEERVFKRGKNVQLNWTSGNLSGQVNIELFKGQERIPVENNVSNVGRYDWYIPGSIKKGSDYRLRFTNSKDRNDFVETPEFTIKPKIPLLLKVVGVAVVGGGVFLATQGGGNTPASNPQSEDPLPLVPGTPPDN